MQSMNDAKAKLEQGIHRFSNHQAGHISLLQNLIRYDLFSLMLIAEQREKELKREQRAQEIEAKRAQDAEKKAAALREKEEKKKEREDAKKLKERQKQERDEQLAREKQEKEQQQISVRETRPAPDDDEDDEEEPKAPTTQPARKKSRTSSSRRGSLDDDDYDGAQLGHAAEPLSPMTPSLTSRYSSQSLHDEGGPIAMEYTPAAETSINADSYFPPNSHQQPLQQQQQVQQHQQPPPPPGGAASDHPTLFQDTNLLTADDRAYITAFMEGHPGNNRGFTYSYVTRICVVIDSRLARAKN